VKWLELSDEGLNCLKRLASASAQYQTAVADEDRMKAELEYQAEHASLLDLLDRLNQATLNMKKASLPILAHIRKTSDSGSSLKSPVQSPGPPLGMLTDWHSLQLQLACFENEYQAKVRAIDFSVSGFNSVHSHHSTVRGPQEMIVRSADCNASALTYSAHVTVWRSQAFLPSPEACVWAPRSEK
jgi:hypothetical protein